jgi:hypothetical protein
MNFVLGPGNGNSAEHGFGDSGRVRARVVF